MCKNIAIALIIDNICMLLHKMMKILDGKAVSKKILANVSSRVDILKEVGVTPQLTFFLIGNDPASTSYVMMKEKACKSVGMASEVIRLPADVEEQQVLHLIQERNCNPNVHGMMIQLRIPEHLDERKILQSVDPGKDVDGLHEKNQAHPEGNINFAAATAKGVLLLLEHYQIPIKGRRVFLLGRTNLFGIPFRNLVRRRKPEILGYYGRDWEEHLGEMKEADIVVSAFGGGRILITPNMVKDGVVLVDVGLGPDIAFDQFMDSNKEGWITPTKGGTGPMTVAAIVMQTVEAAERSLVLSSRAR
jgi:methylenetetrahydrofolate dehydrogenase (NADP+) / methenyltetrahydrofolate cyclohydrolase